MEKFISNSVQLFSNFVSENRALLKKNQSENSVISFAFECENPEHDIINYILPYEKSFYFEKPNRNYLIAAVDCIINIIESGEGRFAVTDKKIKVYKDHFISNLESLKLNDIPLFVGAMKFTPEHPDENWKDFNDSAWFIPKIIFFNNEEKNYLIYNCINTGSFENITNKFEKDLDTFLSIDVKQINNAELRNITGDSPKDKKKYKSLINSALDIIDQKVAAKIVISRKIELLLSGEPNLISLISQLRKDYSDCSIFLCHNGKSNFFGASPERLAYFNNSNIYIDALAGSAARGNSPEEDKKIEEEILKSKKNLNEHQYVIDFLKNVLSNYSNDVKIENFCSVKKLNNIQHLMTDVSAVISNDNTIFHILKEIYPTPAICGFPKDESLSVVKKLEPQKRGLYSGIVGWFNFDDTGEFIIGIRSALQINNRVIAYAGGGIVNDSNPDEEYKETELKLKPILSLFKNENKN